MPMVPTSFVPGVDQQSGQTPRQSGPFVAPMENRAPGLLQQMGAATEQTGLGLMREGQTIGDRIRDQLDDTAVKNAETQLLGSVESTLHGPTGYLNARGQNAVSGYDDAAQAITKAKQDAQSTLTNDLQRRMFAPVADRHLITFGAEMNDHRFQQVASVGAKSATDRVDAHVPFAVNARNGWQQTDAEGKPTGDFQAHLSVIQQEAAHAATLMYGVAPDSDIAQAMVRSATTEVARGVVNGYLQDHAYQEAKTFFDAWNGKGMIDEKTAEVLGNAIKENGDREFSETTGNAAALKQLGQKGAGAAKPSFAYPVTGGTITQQYGQPEKGGAAHNGIDIAVPAGTRVMAPGSGTVLKVWDDEQNGGGRSMLVQLENGYTAGFAHLSATNYKPGDQVTQGQPIALSGDSGWNSTGAHLHYTLTDPDGKKVDPANVNQATPQQKAADLNNFTDPRDLQAAIEDVRGTVADPVLQKQTVNYLESLQRKARVQEDEIRQQNYRTVQDQYFAAGGDYAKVMRQNPEGWAQLTEQQKYLFKKGLPRENDFDTLSGFILHPETLTVPNVTAARMKLTDETALSLLEKATAMQGHPEKVMAASVDNEQIENTLNRNGLGAIVSAKFSQPKPGELLTAEQQTANQFVAQKVALWTEIKDQVDAEQQITGRELTRARKQEIYDATVLNSQFLKAPGWEGGVAPWQLSPAAAADATYTTSRGVETHYAQMPEGLRAALIRSLVERRQPVTEQNIYDTWVNAGMPGARK